jgi:hypothetical protein
LSIRERLKISRITAFESVGVFRGGYRNRIKEEQGEMDCRRTDCGWICVRAIGMSSISSAQFPVAIHRDEKCTKTGRNPIEHISHTSSTFLLGLPRLHTHFTTSVPERTGIRQKGRQVHLLSLGFLRSCTDRRRARETVHATQSICVFSSRSTEPLRMRITGDSADA